MSRKSLMLAAIILVFTACEIHAAVINSTWVGGEEGLWENANNWNPPVVPHNNGISSFYVTINSDGGEVEVGLQENHTITRLDSYGNVELENLSGKYIHLIFANIASDVNCLWNHGVLAFHGSDAIVIWGWVRNITGAELIVNSEVILSQGNLENSGNMMIVPIEGDLSVHHDLYNNGIINLYGGTFSADNTLDNTTDGQINGFGVVYGTGPLVNKGIITASSGALALASDGTISNMGILRNDPSSSLAVKHIFTTSSDVNNLGKIEANAGGGIAFDCNLINEPNGIVNLLGGNLSAKTIIQLPDANFVGFGGITGDVVIDPNAIIKLTGPTNLIGDVEINENAELEISDGLTLITGQTTCNGTIHMKGGYVIPQGGLSGDCNIIWEPGIYTNVADFNIDGNVNFKDLAYFANTWLWQSAWQ